MDWQVRPRRLRIVLTTNVMRGAIIPAKSRALKNVIGRFA
jgi:hypothetical protein